MNRRSIILFLLGGGLFSQDAPVEGDRARRMWSTEFRQSREETSAPPAPAAGKPALLGLTLWRLRPSRALDQARLIVHEEVSKVDAEFTPERISLSTRLLPNDRIRLSVESAQAGYLYVISQESYSGGTLGKPHLIFPSKRMYGGANQMASKRPVDIPELSNGRPYLTLQRSRPDQAAEVLTFLVTPSPLPGMMVQSQPVPIDPAQWEVLRKKWGAGVQRIETGGTAPWTPAEKAASEGKRSLGASDPLPQNLYRTASSPGLLFSVPLSLAQ